MKRTLLKRWVVLLLAALAPLTTFAGEHDGSNNLLCAVLHSTQCVAETQKCKSGPAWNYNLPVFIDLNFKSMEATTTRVDQDDRVSKIKHLEMLPGNRLSIQGADGDYSWSALISDSSGSLTLVIAGEDLAFTVFGACTPR
jgi:hypothetical protein